jgi:hypothetical protein
MERVEREGLVDFAEVQEAVGYSAEFEFQEQGVGLKIEEDRLVEVGPGLGLDLVEVGSGLGLDLEFEVGLVWGLAARPEVGRAEKRMVAFDRP